MADRGGAQSAATVTTSATRARVAAPMILTLALLATLGAACSPPAPLDLTGSDGPYGVAVTRNLAIGLPDGRVLHADLYEPTDPATGDRLVGPFPVVVGFTPYGKASAPFARDIPGGNSVNLTLVRHGYLAVAVDIPGTGVSDGAFDLFDHAEAVAGAEIVRWAAALPRSNGAVGMLGHSYSAIVQLFTAAEVGPASPLRAIFPMAASVDPYRDLFTSGGALNVMSPLGLLFGYGVTRSVTPFQEYWDDPVAAFAYAGRNFDQMSRFEAVVAQDMLNNGSRRYDGDWWQQRAPGNVLQRIADNGVAVFLVGGLYDVFQRGEPLLYSGLQNAASGRPVDAPMDAGQTVSDRFQLLTGPWTHGDLGEGIDLSAVQLAWFDRWLKDSPPQEPEPSNPTPLHVIEPDGSTYDASTYPLADAHVERLWLRSNGALSAVAANGPEPGDPIQYDPFGDTCSASTVQFAAGIGAADCLRPMRLPTWGHNLQTYTTGPLDAPLRLAGPVGLTLTATSTTADAVFNVALEDVHPDGVSSTITGGAVLASMRAMDPTRGWPDGAGGTLRPYQSLTREAVTPVPIGVPVRYEVEVRPAFATIEAGHSLRLRIATADFPHIIPLADIANLVGGTQEILHDQVNPSFMSLSIR